MIGGGSNNPKDFKDASSSNAGPGEAAAAASTATATRKSEQQDGLKEEGCSNADDTIEDEDSSTAANTKHSGDPGEEAALGKSVQKGGPKTEGCSNGTNEDEDGSTADNMKHSGVAHSNAAVATDDDMLNEPPSTTNVPSVPQGRMHPPPGAYPVVGPGRTEDTEQEQDANDNDTSTEDEDMVFEGFVPEPTPEEQAQELLRRAITLDDSAVRPINDDPPAEVSDQNQPTEEEKGSSKLWTSPVAFVIFTLIILLAIALGVSLGSTNSNTSSLGSEDSTTSSSSSCTDNFQERYDVAKSIASSITSLEILDGDAASPQSKALDWITCEDEISSNLIDERDTTTGVLPKQANGFKYGGDSGESQVLRRYALAVFFFSTLEQGPWTEEWNFLSPDLHECSWHGTKTRSNFPYGDFDYPGIVCFYEELRQEHIVLDDAEYEIDEVDLNLRIPNNIVGTLPPEFGYLYDVTNVGLENQKGLYGSLPSTIGNMNLYSIGILFGGPEFGGVIPSSLFTIPSIKYVSFLQNEGVWEFPASITPPIKETVLSQLNFGFTGLSGAIPPYLTELTSLKKINFAGNSLEGTIPDLGKLKSLDFISFYDNDLNGTLPESLGQMINLKVMSFGKNNFHGTLPQSLGKLNKLQILDLSYSRLEGTIPNGFSNLSNLMHVSLQQNSNLHGSISAFESLQSLSTLLLYGNNFSSTIPSNLFSNSSGQIFADFGHNNFTGKLPETFSRYATNTSYLAIMGNSFDNDAVDDDICKEARILHADCSSCPCCDDYCCTGDPAGKDSPYCSFDLDFYKLTGLECGTWWESCCNMIHFNRTN